MASHYKKENITCDVASSGTSVQDFKHKASVNQDWTSSHRLEERESDKNILHDVTNVSGFTPNREILNSEKSRDKINFVDVKEVIEKKPVSTSQLQDFNGDQYVSDQKIVITDVQSGINEKFSTLSNAQDIKDCVPDDKVSMREIKEEIVDYDTDLSQHFKINDMIEIRSTQNFVVKNVNTATIKKEYTLPYQLGVQNTENCSSQELNTISIKKEVEEIETDSFEQLGILQQEQGIYSQKETFAVDLATNIDTGLQSQPKIKDIKTCVLDEIFCNTAVVKKEVSEQYSESPQNLENGNCLENSTLNRIIITDVKGGILENEKKLLGHFRPQNIENGNFRETSDIVLKNEHVEMKTVKPDNQFDSLKQVASNGKPDQVKEKEYKCNICSEVFCFDQDLSLHIKMHEELKCKIGSEIIFEEEKHSKQMSVHSKKYKCSFCDKIFSTKNYFSQHLNIHTKEKEYKCTFCDKIFYIKDTFTQHLLIHNKEKEYKCLFCDTTCYRKYDFSQHLNTHTKEKKFKCTFCDKTFLLKSTLTKHLNIHTKKNEYKCTFCDKTFYRKDMLSQHLNIHTKEKEYKCTFCDKFYNRKDNLTCHLNTHTKEKEYKCKFCNKIFYCKRYLNQHLNLHTKNKKYKCTFCNKFFYHKSNLNTHLNLHTKNKEYKCTFCDKYFYFYSSLSKHLKLHTNEKKNE